MTASGWEIASSETPRNDSFGPGDRFVEDSRWQAHVLPLTRCRARAIVIVDDTDLPKQTGLPP